MSDPFGLAPAVGEGRVCSALAWAVLRGPDRRLSGSFGCTEDDLFDLASLTKPLATVSTVALLLEESALGLDDRIGGWLPEAQGQLASASIADLLHHRAGLLAFSEQLAVGLEGNAERRLRGLRFRILNMPLKHRPGSVVYSDLGFILLAWICQRAGRSVDALAQHAQLGGFWAPGQGQQPPVDRFVPSGRDSAGLPLLGRVHDPTCRLVGGQNCGHAGWFGSLKATTNAVRAWLDLAASRPSALPDSARLLIQTELGQRSAGFDVPTPGGTTGGGWSPSSFGHLGYTGTAFWVDPGADRAAILLTNRSWPDDSDRGIADLRRQFFGAVARLES